ncbi:MAG: tetratricopeptide repeat protein [Chroococcidiopsidaceae cyanobacterium CP_BM_ER_R8_30]|nr:tetratricopeptide repeat protein [Chroococcidiopsidaceae cyanobacterium CP_BM_ER_R8_30]
MKVAHFTPSLTKPEDLERIFVQRQELAQHIVELIRNSVLTSSKHHTLLIGPRGIGKTHLVSLIYYRIREMDDLRDRLKVAWLREEEWGVTSFLDFLLRIFRALTEEPNDKITLQHALTERVESLYQLPPATAERVGAALLKEFIGDSTLLLLMENLDELFAGLGEEGQKRLRAFLQETACCTILATSPSLFNGINRQTSPFYGFFRIRYLEELKLEDAIHLLANIAKLEGNYHLESFIRTPTGRARIQAIHHLAGGNPRIYVIFSQFLTRESLDELVQPFMQMLDDLTPYYQARMAWLSPQQRKIVDFLCDHSSSVPVKEIAQRCFITHQTASSQLKDLKEKGYVTSESIGRESFYELREQVMRFCLEVKKQRGEPIQLFVDFLRLWFTRAELQQRLELLSSDAVLEREYVLRALQAIAEDNQDPRVAAYLKDFEAYIDKKDFLHALQVLEKLEAIRGNEWDRIQRGYCLGRLGRHDEALTSFNKAIELNPDEPLAWHMQSMALFTLARYDEALTSFNKAIELEPNIAQAWELRGMVLAALERYDEALVSFNKAIKLELNDAQTWELQGMVLVTLKRYDEALVSLNKAIELDPSNKHSWELRGGVLRILGCYDEALASFDKVIELDSNYACAWGNRVLPLYYLKRYKEALVSSNKAIELGNQSSDIFFIRAESLLALNQWDEGSTALDDALHRFAHADESHLGDTKAVVCHLFNSTHDAIMWRSRIKTLIEIYDKHQVASALGQGLVRSIPMLMSPMVSGVAAQAWLEAWREQVSECPDFRIPLRLLNTAVHYRETKGDPRVLLELPIEERDLLKPLLGIEK